MPDRFLRAAWLRSDKLQALNAETREFYLRLLSLVDDFGTYDGRTNVIASQAYSAVPLKLWPDVDELLVALHRRGLIVRYSNAGKPYVALTQWRNGIRGDRKYPAPPVNVDLPSRRKLTGPYGKPVGWRNPPGSDPVSILLDFDLNPVDPQPMDWRPPSHWGTGTGDRGSVDPDTGELDTGSPDSGSPVSGLPDSGDHQHQRSYGSDVQPQSQLPPQPQPPQSLVTSDYKPSDPGGGDLIELGQEGAWKGLADAQVGRWQGMFPGMAVPDQLERAAAWLEQHREEREAIAKQGNGFGQFLIRWLLREAKPTHRSKGGADA